MGPGGSMDAVTLRLKVIETPTEWVLLCESPEGGLSCRVQAPFDDAGLTQALHGLETSILRSSAKLVMRRGGTSPERTVREFGQRLTEVLLAGDARVIYDRCRVRARQQQVPVQILVSTDGPNVSQIPWEFAVDPDRPDDFLALRFPLARSPLVAAPIEPLAIEPPLRVLGVQSRPQDRPQLDTDAEQERISNAFSTRPDLVDVTWLHGDSWQHLSDALHQPWHVLHFVGHGGFSEELESGYLELSDENGQALRVSATDIGHAIANCPQLRLVVINACESATTGSAGVFASTAAKLMREGIPAVVAMQYEITDPAALAFSAAFYEGVAEGMPVDRAVTRARESLKVTLGSLEWVTPVLFLASHETRIFRVAGAAPPPVVAPVKEPEPVVPSEPPAPDLPVLRPVDTSHPLGPCPAAAVNSDGLVAVAGSDGVVRVWSPASRRELSLCTPPAGAEPTLVAWTPWRRYVATANRDGTVVLWDLEREVEQQVIRPGWQRTDALAISADGRWIATAGGDRTIAVYGMEGDLARRFEVPAVPGRGLYGGTGALGPIAFGPTGRRLVVASGDGTVCELDVHGTIHQVWPHPRQVAGIAVKEDRLATCLTDGRLRLWFWDGRLAYRAAGTSPTTSLAFAPDGQHLVAVGNDRRLVVCRSDGHEVAEALLAGRPVGAGVTAEHVVTVTDQGVVERWALPAGRG